MKKLGSFVFCRFLVFPAAAFMAGAAQVRVEAPPPAHADLEAAACAGMPWREQGAPPPRFVKITLAVSGASSSNNAEFAVCAGPGGEAPDASDMPAVCGFDSGAWTLRADSLRRTFTAAAGPAPVGGRPRTLTVSVWTDGSGEAKRVLFCADGRPLAFGEEADQPLIRASLNPSRWHTLQATARGGVGNVSAAVSTEDGTIMILR